MDKPICELLLVINNETLEKYAAHYFQLHPRARKKPIPHPYHESINKWMIMKRPQMNALKQKWKDFIIWLVSDYGYENIYIDKCKILFRTYYKANMRHDTDNSVPKFILDGLCENNFINDDDCKHILRLSLECDVDKENPRTEIHIRVFEFNKNFKRTE